MNLIAQELNDTIRQANPHVYDMLSSVGKNLFFPKGILSQGAEAKEKAHRFNATIGVATEKGETMHLPSIMSMIPGLSAREALTYASSFGIPPLRQAWQEALRPKNPSLQSKEISLPVVSQAITHGLSVIGDMWVDPGDVIVLPDKLWGNYNLIFAVRRGARLVHYPLFDSRRTFHARALQECLQQQSKDHGKLIVLLNFPNNPTGYTPSPREADRIVTVLTETAEAGTDIVLLADDAYFGLFYERDVLKESIFARAAGMHPRITAIKLDAATKEDFVWGLRVGFITYGVSWSTESRTAYEALEKKTAGAVRGSISNASHLSQELVLGALRSDSYLAEKDEKFRIMQERAHEVKRVLTHPKYHTAWEMYPFNSGYFMCLQLKTVDAEPLRQHLLNTYGVGLISLGKTDLRVAFSCIEKEDVQELFDTVLKGVEDLTR